MTVVWGTNSSETLDQADGATNNADTLLGLDGNDKLFGLKGDDWLKGGGGADELHGGDGVDWADYSDSTQGVDVDLWFGHGNGGSAEGDSYWNIENVWGSGSGDIIEGDNLANHLFGAGGNDWLMGRGGGDYLDGGEGYDCLDYQSSSKAVYVNLSASFATGGDADDDTLVSIEGVMGTAFNDILVGDDQNNNLWGGIDGNDTLTGGGGNDWLMAGAGADLMTGGTGNDYYFVDHPNDKAVELAGEGDGDAVYAQNMDYTLPDNIENMVLTGNKATNATGNALENCITGNGASNIIFGGGGWDYMIGAGGGDFFAWSNTSQTGKTQDSADWIVDFSFAAGDRLDVSGIDADVYAGGNQAFTFIGTNAFSGTPGEINYYHANGNTYVQLQTGTAVDVEAIICLQGIMTPQASWFML